MRVIVILILGILIGGASVWVWSNYRPRIIISTGAVSPTPSSIGATSGLGTLEMITPIPTASVSASPTPVPSPTVAPNTPMSASLESVRGSGYTQSGGASLVAENGKVRVTVLVNSVADLKNPQPAHIHVGGCPGSGAIVYPLNDIVNGQSVTVLNTTLAQIRRQLPLAINIHKSSAQPDVYTACGVIK